MEILISDVVISWMTKAHVYVSPAAALLRVPTLWFQHGLPSRSDPIDRAAALMPARAVLAPSHAVAAAQLRIWPGRRAGV